MRKKRLKCFFSNVFFEERAKNSLRLILIFLFAGILNVQASDMLKGEIITFSKQTLPLSQMFKQITAQTGYNFFYSDDELDVKKTVTLPALKVTIEEALRVGLAPKYSFRIDGKKIIISPVPITPTQQQPKQTQKVKISGRVFDAYKKPLAGVAVVVVDSYVGIVTDAEGRYSMDVVKTDNMRLKYIFMGMKPEERVWNGEKEINVVMHEDNINVQDIVVTGIFDKPRESYTGSVVTITQKDMKMFKGQNMLQTLRNIDPAINIVQNNMAGSNPNLVPEFNIRGKSSLPMSVKDLNEGVSARLNEPLVIMDGFEISIQQLIDLNDDQVQSINIMKDASATAIYGSRGANGVIVITTQKPEVGKLRVSASAGVNIETPDLTSYNLLNALEKIDFENKMGLYSSIHPLDNIAAQEDYYRIRREVLGGVDTYWLSQPLRTGIGQSYNLKLEGGTEEFRWSADGNYNETVGVMKGSQRKTFNGSINLIYQKNKFTFMNRTAYTYSRGDQSNYGAFTAYAEMNPYWKLHDERGRLINEYYYTPGNKYVTNPLSNAQYGSKDYDIGNNISNNFSVDWKPFEGFVVRGKVGLSKKFNTHDIYTSPNDSRFSTVTELSKRGSYDYTTGQSFIVDADITASYAKTFADRHQIYAGFNMSAAESQMYSYGFKMRGYNDRFDFLPNAVGHEENGKPSGSESTDRRVGYTANLNYTFDSRYYVDASFRMDGSSQFGTDQKFAPFWSVGLGWNLHNEEFIKNLNVFNQLQVRMSYGLTGSQQFAAYQALTTYEYDVNDRYILSTPAYLKGYGNNNLKWQQTTVVNFGLNFSMFNNRLTGSLDYYSNVTDNLLSLRTIPASTGFTAFADNVGKVANTGLELMLSGYPIRNSNGFSWMLSGKIAHNANKIIELSSEIKRQTQEYLTNNVEMPSLFFEGGSTTDIYAVRSLGIDPSTGQELFYDKDGNIVYDWNADAKTLVGNTEPKFRGNISSSFRYKAFSLNLSFGFHFGGQQYNTTLINRVEVPHSALMRNVDKRVLEERWYQPGQVSFYKSFYDLDGNPAGRTKASSRFVQNDNMFSLQGASASYQFTGGWLQKHLSVQMLELGVNVSDIFYISTVKRERGLNYPFSRRCSFSAKLSF